MTGQSNPQGNVEQFKGLEKSKSTLSETAEFVHRINKDYTYPELYADLEEDIPQTDEKKLTTDTDELDRAG